MLKSVLSALLLAALSISAAQAADAIGFKETELPDVGGDRPLHVSIWYPTDDVGPVASVGENRVFYGVTAIMDAKPVDDAHPLVVLSHGYGGSWRNLSWLAWELVHQGYVVAAPDHPGTTTFDKSPAQAAKLWNRPHDLSRVIDALTENPSLAGAIEPARIAVIGHSLGGWTVTALGGARFSTDRFAQDCKIHPNPRTCGLSAELGIAQGHDNPLDGDLSDARIGAIVSLDLGLARGFTPESLAAFHVPALIIGAGVDIGDLPAKLESGYLAANLPQATSSYAEIPDAMHFSFMQVCKPGAADLIEEDTPGDGIVCKDGGTRDRKAIHREVADMITAFLAKVIPPK
ncbi:alpha/beta hydrolase [Sinorhizobium garamanticum]|uniref:Alpha/beta hydrolase n=1 Tax=Sinorhizobium garamanticum TaxID=680247 RepID=A0ABY8D4F4_9HYPH|nr:alpha/beta fold hydrolase [Sinorhizobium garamanticum]WEX85745.1 alpha/beta hydrolase [Sinorhizobium garamanticum]